MRKTIIDEKNTVAIGKVMEFRKQQHPRNFGKIDQVFQNYKNIFPYFGFIDVDVCEHHLVMFSGNDDLIAMTYFWHGASSYEAYSLKIWSELAKDSDTVLDVGAFTGLYSLVAASSNTSSNIVAFEPSRRTHGRLLLNIFSNGFGQRITAKACAVSIKAEKINLLQFRGPNILGNGASLLEKRIPVTDDSEIVDTVSLDSLCDNDKLNPDLIKIDVEGAETLVLKGMQKVLSENRPKCIIEVTASTFDPVCKMLEKHAYDILIVDDQNMETYSIRTGVSKVCNILATPKPQ